MYHIDYDRIAILARALSAHDEAAVYRNIWAERLWFYAVIGGRYYRKNAD
ncbi:MAG: hypothetical protein IKL80_02675 [Clostridia bacterium]|nr:hypothetical protein [Clostridia bacterium]